jgi:CSLREA domain-containing protein
VLEGRVTPTTINVTTTLDEVDPNDGLISLREAINQANADSPGDVIVVPHGTYMLTLGHLDILQSMTIQGQGGDTPLNIIDGDGGNTNDRVFNILPSDFNANPQVTIEYFTIQNGHAPQTPDGTAAKGGGIYNAATLNLSFVWVKDCYSSGYGGGIANDGGTLTLYIDQVFGNSAQVGGGGLFNAAGTVTSSYTVFDGNSAEFGGGVLNGDGTSTPLLTLNPGEVRNNFASMVGGGIDNAAGGTANLTNISIHGNEAGSGEGGGLVNSGTATLDGFDVADNTAFNGGGIANDGGTLTLQNDIAFGAMDLSGNFAANGGGGLFNVSGTVTSSNCLISGNEANFGGGVLNGGGSSTALLTLSSGQVQVSDNFASLAGGGIYNATNGTANLTGMYISANLAGDGGGGLLNVGDATLSNVSVIDNAVPSGSGGGIWNGGGSMSSTLTLIGQSYIARNSAVNGGGLYNGINGIVNATIVTITGNAALGGNGGAIFNDLFGTLNLYGVAVMGNSAANGGGVYNFASGTVHLNSDLVSGNNVTGAGGGIYNAAGGGDFQPGLLDGSGSLISGNVAGSTDPNPSDGPVGGGLLNAGDRSGLQATIINNFSGTGAGFRKDDLAGV